MGHEIEEAGQTSIANKERSESVAIDPRFACKHYKRKCEFVAPCCQKTYRCRFCHDEAEDHVLDGFAVREVVCSNCNLKQELRSACVECETIFGAYHCLKCKLFDDDLTRNTYHCDGCGICRVGKAKDYFHCNKCDMCLPIHMKNKHTCIEDVSKKDCPVCLEDIHTSREPAQIPPCHHLIHRSCFQQLRLKGFFRCPVCLKSMFKIPWEDYDLMLANNPMPPRFVGVLAKIKCFDCDINSDAEFHFVSLKCGSCGSHNTARNTGPLFKMVDGQEVEFDIVSAATPRSAAQSQSTSDVGSEESTESGSDGEGCGGGADQSSGAATDSSTWSDLEANDSENESDGEDKN